MPAIRPKISSNNNNSSKNIHNTIVIICIHVSSLTNTNELE